MDRNFKITINLLPHLEPKNVAAQRRFQKVQLISTLVILLLFFAVSTSFALTILQKANLDKATRQVSDSEKAVSQQQSKEVSLTVLKNRLVSIDQIQSVPSKHREIFTLVNNLTPQSIFANSLSTDKSGNLIVSFISASIVDLDLFIEDLINKDKNEGKIASVDVDSLSRGRDGIYRISLKISTK
ncbi:MAG: hypothetical protein Q8P92_03410 [Candidatus Daviesbacteria bacterium]|nr:hypothetical protein [Candidatus Daviesbacteria bacterium]